MKYPYSKNFITVSFLIIMLMFSYTATKAQCPFGFPTGTTPYDTTIATPAGINTLLIKFPQADPLQGMVTCLKLCVSITGVVDSVSVENNSASPQTADVFYIRTDQITGPGLTSPLTNSINYHYGPYALGPKDGVTGSGPDFVYISHDTLLNAVSMCQTITNLDSLFQFYGHDSVTYQYNITAFTNVSCTGGNYNSTVATSALVNFHFEYCTCPGYILPLNIRRFNAERVADNKAKLTWNGFDDPNNPSYHYETEVSRDGSKFSLITQVPANPSGKEAYSSDYITGSNESGIFYFRVKQIYSNGYTRFSEIKQVQLKSSTNPKFIIYPNPSDGIVGIKFDNNQGGKMLLQIFNSHGQKMMQKEIVVTGSSYQQVATLRSGNYWLRLTDVTSQLSSVNQLFIK
jgi:Secretion system C-terminal sorting domain